MTTTPNLASLTALPLSHFGTPDQPLHTISLLVRNQPGVLVRVALVFSRRGYNIESLVVSPGIDDTLYSRMTITCRGEQNTLEQIIKQLFKLIDVVQAVDHTGQAVVETEIALVKIKASLSERTEVLQIAEHYKGMVKDYQADSLIIQVSGQTDKLDNFIDLLRPFGVVELVRSGKLLMARGTDAT